MLIITVPSPGLRSQFHVLKLRIGATPSLRASTASQLLNCTAVIVMKPSGLVSAEPISRLYLSIQNYWKLRCTALLLAFIGIIFLLDRKNVKQISIHIATLSLRLCFANQLKRVNENSGRDIFQLMKSMTRRQGSAPILQYGVVSVPELG